MTRYVLQDSELKGVEWRFYRTRRLLTLDCILHFLRLHSRLLTLPVFAAGSVLEDEGERLVAVKVLKEGVSREARDDFTREVRIMSGFDHENILKLIGVVTIGQ